MAEETAIEWCDSTLNLMAGCDGCELWNPKGGIRHCYAGTMIDGDGRRPGYGGRKGWPASFDQPTLFPERLAKAIRWSDLTGKDRPGKPWLNGLPRLIFLNDMGDTFTESLPLDWLAPHLPAMADCPHVWILLTKRPHRMRRFFEMHACPANFWLLASVTDQPTANGRVRELLQIEAPVRGLSCEPLLSRVDLSGFHLGWSECPRCGTVHDPCPEFPLGSERWCGGDFDRDIGCDWRGRLPVAGLHLHWLIIGAESGPNARPMRREDAQSLKDQGLAAGIPVFFKQEATSAGHKIPLPMMSGQQWTQMPAWRPAAPAVIGRGALEAAGQGRLF